MANAEKLEEKLADDVTRLIDELSDEEKRIISDHIIPKPNFLKHYNELQKDWISNYFYFWGQENNQDPKIKGCGAKDYGKSIQPLRFRIYFAVKYPEEIEISSKENADLVNRFLNKAKAN